MSIQRLVPIGGDTSCYHQPMVELGIKVGNGNIKSVLYLRDENYFVFVKGLECHPPFGAEVVIDEELWRVVECTDRVECERVVN